MEQRHSKLHNQTRRLFVDMESLEIMLMMPLPMMAMLMRMRMM